MIFLFFKDGISLYMYIIYFFLFLSVVFFNDFCVGLSLFLFYDII